MPFSLRQLAISSLLILSSTLSQAEVIDIDNAQLDRLLKAGVPLVDIRLAQEWEETGIIPGSQLLTFFDERGRYDAATWLGKVQAFAKPEQPLIVICRSGNRTRPVSQFLSQQAGYTKVYNVRQGIKSWIASGGNLAPAISALAACRAAKTC